MERASRRDTLRFIGAASVLTCVGCANEGQAGTDNIGSDGGLDGSPNPDTGGAGSSNMSEAGTVAEAMPLSCIVRPAQTEGPYFVDENLRRADIRSDPGDLSIKDGAPLRLILGCYRPNGAQCAPLVGALVDIWQCDAFGVYSDVLDANGRFDTRGNKSLRGNLSTEEDGTVEFLTIYPGWYAGRTVHIHFKIRIDPVAQQGHEFTSQLYFEESMNDQVFALPPYSAQGPRTTRNAQDGIFLQGGSSLILAISQEAQGYVGRFNVGLLLP